VDGRLQLEELKKPWLLKIFVECDPASHDSFEGFRVSDDFYTQYSVELVRGLLGQVPSFSQVEFDAYPSIHKSSPLLQALVKEAKAQNKRISWGPERGWEKVVEVNLTNVLESLSLGKGLNLGTSAFAVWG
jgi:hypothetical protein